MSIRTWRPEERPREKLLLRGPQALSDAELLALLVRSGLPGRSALDVARQALTRAGGLRALLDASRRDVCALPGFGPARYAELQACLEILRRYLGARMERGEPLASPGDARRFLPAHLRGHPFEVFACLFLDNRHRVITFEELFRGTIDGASVYPREVVRRALQHNAAALILAHNHPSGVPEPSAADISLTLRLREALELVDVRVLDHIVIGDGDPLSLSELGHI